MSGFDEIIHQPHRLRIMAALDSDPDPIGFPRLKAIAGATDGNLGAHLATLERAGFVSVNKQPVGARSRTLVQLTPGGRKAFRAHADALREIVDTAAHTPAAEQENER